MKENTSITIQTTINVPVQKVWQFWTSPEHITQWCNASDDWHAPSATNDLQAGGKFTTRMEAKDGSFGFDFCGVYDEVRTTQFISYTMGDGRKVSITFSENENETNMSETFDPEDQHPLDMQRAGWQAILDNFKKYVETN